MEYIANIWQIMLMHVAFYSNLINSEIQFTLLPFKTKFKLKTITF